MTRPLEGIGDSERSPRSTAGIDPADLLDVALEAAGAAAELVQDKRPPVLEVDRKSSATDHVTQMDRASEQLLRRTIGARRPTDAIVGEEEGRAEGSSPVTWWLDPIDGTTNYVYDHPGYAVSVAAAVEVSADTPDGDGLLCVPATLLGRPHGSALLRVLAAVVADPTHGRIYEAALGGGARCNGEPIHLPSECPPLSQILVATGFGYDPERRRRQGAVVAELLPRIRDIRRMGAAALDLCSVAAGRVDAYFETGLSAWDLAAGVLIAAEAGAAVGSLEGGPSRPGSIVAAHPGCLEELRLALADCGVAATIPDGGHAL